MELVEVKITGQAITARYGTLNTGTILRTDAAFAKHLVEDCGAAEYLTAKQPEQADTEQSDTAAAQQGEAVAATARSRKAK